ncbi:pantetheine-phosphate adenylyltransferase [Candidatus Roizmanbacteria bacterium]|nr:pantetheine-phosphate adenylyltransferase [Candidatus Roizmanbacteria bacterium]
MKYKITLIVGRFQPFHKGHLFLIKKALEKADKIIIGIGSANVSDENNPIDFETRKKIIKAVAYKEKFGNRLIKIAPLDDFFDDKKWLKNLEKQVGKFNLALGNNDWTNNILKKAGYKVMKVDYYKRSLYEGWRIRKLIKEGKKWHDRIPDYLISNFEFLISKFNHVVLGGTFDHFHKGHKALLEKAFEIGKKVTIGIATEEIYKNKFLSKTVEPFSTRQKNIIGYINYHLNNDRAKMVKIIPFSEFTGGADKDKNIDAIVVSNLTYPNALKINELREKNKLHLLKIIIINDVLADDGELISSERIRAGEINRKGKVMGYELGVRRKKELFMPESLRPTLQRPLGKIYKTTRQIIVGANLDSPKKPVMVIAVGDIIVDSLLKEGIEPDVKVIDFRSRRKPIKTDTLIKDSLNKDCLYLNNPGTINLKTAEKLKQMIQQRSVLSNKVGPYGSWLVVDGEEDLLALPAILFAPLNSLVLYGHWQLGIIAVEIDEKIKNKARNIVNKFL